MEDINDYILLLFHFWLENAIARVCSLLPAQKGKCIRSAFARPYVNNNRLQDLYAYMAHIRANYYWNDYRYVIADSHKYE